MRSKIAKKNYRFTRFLVLVWIGFLYLPANLAAQSSAGPYKSEFSLNKLAANTGQYNFIIAQDNRNGEKENGSDPKQGEESGQANEGEKQLRKQKKEADPIKSFEPTEKVKADQAVDFPYDI
jgi:hypothetical protein